MFYDNVILVRSPTQQSNRFYVLAPIGNNTSPKPITHEHENIVPQKSVVWNRLKTTLNMFELCRPTSVESCCLIGWLQVP